MFEAIVSFNGWDGVMAALQLLSHLEGKPERGPVGSGTQAGVAGGSRWMR